MEGWEVGIEGWVVGCCVVVVLYLRYFMCLYNVGEDVGREEVEKKKERGVWIFVGELEING